MVATTQIGGSPQGGQWGVACFSGLLLLRFWGALFGPIYARPEVGTGEK